MKSFERLLKVAVDQIVFLSFEGNMTFMGLHFYVGNIVRFAYILRRRNGEIYFRVYLGKLLEVLEA